MGIITKYGSARKVETSMTVGEAAKPIVASKNGLRWNGAVRVQAPAMAIHPFEENPRRSYMLLDTLVITWEIFRKHEVDTITFALADMFEDPLFETSTAKNYLCCVLSE